MYLITICYLVLTKIKMIYFMLSCLSFNSLYFRIKHYILEVERGKFIFQKRYIQ